MVYMYLTDVLTATRITGELQKSVKLIKTESWKITKHSRSCTFRGE